MWQQLHDEPTTIRPSVVAQVNVRELCQYCHESYQPSVIEQIELNEICHTDDENVMKQLHELEALSQKSALGSGNVLSSTQGAVNRLWRADSYGCERCDHTGFGGDIGIFETYKTTDKFYTALLAKKSLPNLQQIAIKEGMISLKVDALVKALRGLIDFRSFLTVASTTDKLYDNSKS